jgi:REP element-mobilizing transposase RayT
MARPLRVEYSGACYHVMNRGNRRQTVFESQADIDLFLDKLGEFAELYEVQVFCYCLMHNHFHIYLRTQQANLSKFMQALLTSFTVIKNRRDKSSGHLFQGRYKAIIVEDELYGAELSRYIHLNPVRTISGEKLNLSKKRKLLRNTKLSSYPSIIGLRKKADWLHSENVLTSWGDTLNDQQKHYAEYVERALVKEIENPFDLVKVQAILGSNTFIDKLRKGLTDISEKLNIKRELGAKSKLISSASLDTVVAAVCKFYKVETEYVMKKHSKNNEARQVMLYLACKYCRGKYTLSEIGSNLGPLTIGSITRSRYNIEKSLKENKNLKFKIEKMGQLIVKS